MLTSTNEYNDRMLGSGLEGLALDDSEELSKLADDGYDAWKIDDVSVTSNLKPTLTDQLSQILNSKKET